MSKIYTQDEIKDMAMDNIVQELIRPLNVPLVGKPEVSLRLRLNGSLLWFAGREGIIMEDSIELFTITEAKEAFEEMEGEVGQVGQHGHRWNVMMDLLACGKYGVINIDIWNKSTTKLTSVHIDYIRKIVDEMAIKYNLAKIYSWGRDDGGSVMFYNNYAVISSYYGRGVNEFDVMQAPRTEDEFWETAKQQLDLDSL